MSTRSDGTEGSESAEKAASDCPLEGVKLEWRLLWRDRFDDRVRAESIANREYPLLFVERGRVIVATRDFRPLNFKQILSLHGILSYEQIFSPHPSVGGWGKFARTVLNNHKRFRRWVGSAPRRNRVKNFQLKKGGRGWLHHRVNR